MSTFLTRLHSVMYNAQLTMMVNSIQSDSGAHSDVTKGTDISFGLLTMHQAMCGFLANTWEGATQRQFSLS